MPQTPTNSAKKNKPKTFCILIFFLGLMLAGISLGEPDRVLEQAAQLCLSCIGIG